MVRRYDPTERQLNKGFVLPMTSGRETELGLHHTPALPVRSLDPRSPEGKAAVATALANNSAKAKRRFKPWRNKNTQA